MSSPNEQSDMLTKTFYISLLLLASTAGAFLYLYLCWFMWREQSALLAPVPSKRFSAVPLIEPVQSTISEQVPVAQREAVDNGSPDGFCVYKASAHTLLAVPEF
ncbi:hypothetical protein AAVH_27243 [Aphelenchoides avenae]|nr:hypothetical protein AAVH_27243 [Aphelenchus avenae]